MAKTTVALVVIALLHAGFVHSATTSRLTGTVVDAEGAALPGVTVSLWSEVLIGGRQSEVADADGRVAFNLLPPGPYSLRAELIGFVPVELEARVALDRETQVRVLMVATQFSGSVEVTGQAPLVDTTAVSGGESYDQEFLARAAVGMDGRSWMSALYQAAGAINLGGSPTSVAEVKNPQVLGSLQTDNVYLLDWLNSTDPLTSTFSAWLNYDAIQEVSVLDSGLDAEYGHALGGVINLVTRSGGNTFSGAVDLRYRNQDFNEAGEHFDPEDDVSSMRDTTATLGGPLKRDRLWFFAAAGQRLERETPTGAPVDRELDRRDWIAKLTWQVSIPTRAIVKLSGFPLEYRNVNAGHDVAADAGGSGDYDTSLYQAELHAVLSDSLLLSLQAGFNRHHNQAGPTSGDLDRPGFHNLDAGLWFGNYPSFFRDEKDSDQYRASLSWFLDDLLGRHELKAGVEYRRLDTSTSTAYTGGWYADVLEVFDPETNPDGSGCATCDQDGDGYVDQTLHRYTEGALTWGNGGHPTRARAELASAFAQDSWRPLANLTLKAGLRWDGVEHSNDRGQRVADFDTWQPRLGLAWDPLADGKSVLRLSWGRTMHPAGMAFDHVMGFSEGEETYTGYEHLCRWPGTPLCDREWLRDNYALDGQEYVTVDEDGDEHYWYLTGGYLVPFETVDTLGVGHLRPQWAETFTAAVERQLGGSTSLELEYVNKNTRDLLEDTCNNNTWLWDSTEPEPSLDDPATWTDASGCTGYVLVNLPGARRDYEAWIAKLETRLKPLRLKASYTYASSTGSADAEAWNAYTLPAYDAYPATWVNAYGAMNDDYRHVVKLSGFASLPWDLTASLACAWRSAPPVDVWGECTADSSFAEAGYDPALDEYCAHAPGWQILLEPRGSRRGRAWYNLDLGLAKAIPFKDLTLELNLAVLNAWGDERPEEYSEGDPDPLSEVGTPTDYSEPRRYQVGVRVEF